MKKFFCFVLFVLITSVLLLSVSAQDNTIGYIYSTDILTFVNGLPINGYNIGGKTVVIAEDLDGYGFSVEYDEGGNLKIQSYFTRGSKEFSEISRGKVGKILGRVRKSATKVYYNGVLVNGYDIGGKTAICIEEIGDISGSANAKYGYSDYLAKSIWDGKNRTISLESYISNEEEILGVSRVYHTFIDNVIYTHSDDFCAQSEFRIAEGYVNDSPYIYSPGTGASKYTLKPLYFDNHGEQVVVGLCVVNPNNQKQALIFVHKPEYVIEMINTFKAPQKSYSEAVAYFSDTCKVIKEIHNNDYTVLTVEHNTKGLLFVYVNKQGGFVVQNYYSAYADREINSWFVDSTNTVIHSVYPFAGPHGATTAHLEVDLSEYDYQ